MKRSCIIIPSFHLKKLIRSINGKEIDYIYDCIKMYTDFLTGSRRKIPVQLEIYPGDKNDMVLRFCFSGVKEIISSISDKILSVNYMILLWDDFKSILITKSNTLCIVDTRQDGKLKIFPRGMCDLNQDGFTILDRNTTYSLIEKSQYDRLILIFELGL